MAASRICGLMIDLSGTVHVGDQLLPGVAEALSKLRAAQIPIKFVTNTSKESQSRLHQRLQKAGLDLKRDEIFTSLTAARTLVDRDKLRPMLVLEDAAMEDFAGVDISNSNCVVVGLAPSQFNYEKMNEAFRLVKAGARLIAINKSRYLMREDGLAIGTGAAVAALEYCADREAEIVGKPSKGFFHLAHSAMGAGVPLEQTIMVGDDVRDDVLAAQEAGLRGALVRTGKYQQGDEIRKDGKPDFVFDSLMDVANFVLDQN